MPARVGIVLDGVDEIGNLVDASPVEGRPRAPLITVNRAEITVFVGPIVPDRDVMFVEVLDIGVAG